MEAATIEAWKQVIRGTHGIPNAAEVRHVEHGDAVRFESDWLAGDDPARAHKRTRTLRIDVSSHASQAYAAQTGAGRAQADQRFRAIVLQAVNTFDPTNDAPMGNEPAPHHIVVDVDDLFP